MYRIVGVSWSEPASRLEIVIVIAEQIQRRCNFAGRHLG